MRTSPAAADQGVKRSWESPGRKVCSHATSGCLLSVTTHGAYGSRRHCPLHDVCVAQAGAHSAALLPIDTGPAAPRPDLPVRAAAKAKPRPLSQRSPRAPAWPPHPPPGPGSPRGQAHCCFHGDVCTLTPAFLHPWPNKEGFQVETSSLKLPLLPCPRWPLSPRGGGERPPFSAQDRPRARPSSGRGLPPPDLLGSPFPAQTALFPRLETCLSKGPALPQLLPSPRTTAVHRASPQEPAGCKAPRVTWANPPLSRAPCRLGERPGD